MEKCGSIWLPGFHRFTVLIEWVREYGKKTSETNAHISDRAFGNKRCRCDVYQHFYIFYHTADLT